LTIDMKYNRIDIKRIAATGRIAVLYIHGTDTIKVKGCNNNRLHITTLKDTYWITHEIR